MKKNKTITYIIGLLVLFPFIFVSTAKLYERYKRYSFDELLKTSSYYSLDSSSTHIHTPNYKKEIEWKEHKNGLIILATNNLGFREAEPTLRSKPDSIIKVLVTGDSHTDGVINNSESFPNLLELQVNKVINKKHFEIINGGTGFYSFKNYAKFINKYVDLQPDLFVVTVYTGNDFIENIFYEQENLNIQTSLENFYYRIKKNIFHLSTKMASSQSTNQILFFKTFPEKKKLSLLIAQNYLKEILKTCNQQRINLLVLFIPTKLDVEADFNKLVRDKTSWSKEDVSINKNLKNKLINWLINENISTIDMEPYLIDKKIKLFWDSDHHLNSNGHKIVSDALFRNYNWENLIQ